MSSLQANFKSGSGLTFYTDDGRKRSIRVYDAGKLFPPKGRWGNRTYSVITQVNCSTLCTSEFSPQPVINNTSTINMKDQVVNTGDVCRTKQATLVVDQSSLKLGPELIVST